MRGILSTYSKGRKLFFSSFLPLFVLLVIKNFNYGDMCDFFSSCKDAYVKDNFFNASEILLSKYTILVLFWAIVIGSLIYSVIATYHLKVGIDAGVTKAKQQKQNYRCNKNVLIGYNDILTYLMTYMLALVSWSPGKLGDTVVNVCLLFIVFIFYAKQKQLAYNIFLYFWGYNILTAEGTTLLTKLSLKEVQGKVRRNSVLYNAEIYGDIILLVDPSEDKVFD